MSGSFGIVLESCWDHFRIVWGSFGNNVGIVSGSFWDSFWNRFGIILESVWDNLGIGLGHILSPPPLLSAHAGIYLYSELLIRFRTQIPYYQFRTPFSQFGFRNPYGWVAGPRAPSLLSPMGGSVCH